MALPKGITFAQKKQNGSGPHYSFQCMMKEQAGGLKTYFSRVVLNSPKERSWGQGWARQADWGTTRSDGWPEGTLSKWEKQCPISSLWARWHLGRCGHGEAGPSWVTSILWYLVHPSHPGPPLWKTRSAPISPSLCSLQPEVPWSKQNPFTAQSRILRTQL